MLPTKSANGLGEKEVKNQMCTLKFITTLGCLVVGSAALWFALLLDSPTRVRPSAFGYNLEAGSIFGGASASNSAPLMLVPSMTHGGADEDMKDEQSMIKVAIDENVDSNDDDIETSFDVLRPMKEFSISNWDFIEFVPDSVKEEIRKIAKKVEEEKNIHHHVRQSTRSAEDDVKDVITNALDASSMLCRRIAAGDPNSHYPEILEKTHFRNDSRVAFVVGLEGSGHHLFHELLNNCKRCIASPPVPGFRWTRSFSVHGLFGSMVTKNEIEDQVRYFREGYKKLLPETNSKIRNKTIFINTLPGGAGEFSYPNFKGNCRLFNYPDVRIIGEMLETIGADFRVLLVIRSAIDILLSTSVHRHFGMWDQNARLYIHFVDEVIIPQLERLDPKFIKCMDYDQLPAVPDGLGDWLGIDDANYDMQAAMSGSYQTSRESSKRLEEEAMYMGLDKLGEWKKMQNSIDVMRSKFCEN